MLHLIWFMMMYLSAACAVLGGRGGEVAAAALNGTEKAIGVTVQLGAGYLLFCGLLEIAAALRAERWIQRAFHPLLRRVMPGIRRAETYEAVSLNLSLNLLGVGNAATPAGLEAMKRMEAERERNGSVGHDMNMLLILNATGLQLLPTTVIALRAAAGSADVNAVVGPVMLCTAFSTLVGVGAGLLCRRWGGRTRER